MACLLGKITLVILLVTYLLLGMAEQLVGKVVLRICGIRRCVPLARHSLHPAMSYISVGGEKPPLRVVGLCFCGHVSLPIAPSNNSELLTTIPPIRGLFPYCSCNVCNQRSRPTSLIDLCYSVVLLSTAQAVLQGQHRLRWHLCCSLRLLLAVSGMFWFQGVTSYHWFSWSCARNPGRSPRNAAFL